MSLPRVSVRLQPGQVLVLKELSQCLHANISTIIRAMIGDWLTKNEDILEQIITGERPFNKDWKFNEDE